MLTPAHIASSYLLSQVPTLFNQPQNQFEVLTVIIAGNIVDLDFIWGVLTKKRGDDHHNFITHTPFFVVVIFLFIFLLFYDVFSLATWVLILVSGLFHLFLDDIGYWFCRFGWQEISKYPQINWFYPLVPFAKREYELSNSNLLKDYYSKAKINVLFELVLIVGAILVFLYYK